MNSLMSRHPRLYQINTRVWLKEKGWKTLADIPEETIAEWARDFDIVWLMGVWMPSPKGREVALGIKGLMDEIRETLPDMKDEDVVSSPYSIRDYAVSPLLGGDGALIGLRRRMNQKGLRLILDLVPNHMAIDHAWLTDYPDRFIQGTDADIKSQPQNYFKHRTKDGMKIFAHGKDPYWDGWSDTVQINIFNRDMRVAMNRLVLGLGEMCDGIRCDMAMLVLNWVFRKTWAEKAGEPPAAEIWSEIIGAVKMRFPGFLFIAEVYWDLERELQQLGFDYTYDKKYYDLLRGNDARTIRDHLRSDMEFQYGCARMIENHDEKRAAAMFEEPKARAAALMMSSVPGLHFFHEGQFEGRRIRLPVQLARRHEETADPRIRTFYEALISALQSDVMKNGVWQMLEPMPAWKENRSHERMFLFWWQRGDECRMAAVNYAADASQTYVRLPLSPAFSRSVRLRDLLSPRSHDRDADDLRTRGLYLDMPGFDVHLFAVEPLS